MWTLCLLRSGGYMPIRLTPPPTSISSLCEFLNQSLAIRRRVASSSMVQIGLKKVNNGTNDYNAATFRRPHDFTDGELAQVRACANGFEGQAKGILQQRAASIEELHDDGYDYLETDTLPGNKNGNFSPPLTTDGEREVLPV